MFLKIVTLAEGVSAGLFLAVYCDCTVIHCDAGGMSLVDQ